MRTAAASGECAGVDRRPDSPVAGRGPGGRDRHVHVCKAAVRDSLPHVSTWWPQILAAITTGVTNAASQGINRAINTDAVHLYPNAL